jgi:hypothetical protein
MVGHERAAGAGLFPAGAEHEVLHDQLAAPLEQLRQGARAVRGVEHVGLGDVHPGQRTALAGDLVLQAGEVFLAGQQRLALGQPLVGRHHGVVEDLGVGKSGIHGMAPWLLRAGSRT